MTKPTKPTKSTKSEHQQQYEDICLSLAAHGANAFKALLATQPPSDALISGVQSILREQDFSAEMASHFTTHYTPVAAFDQDGAGAVLFKVHDTASVAIGVRGVDFDSDHLFAEEFLDQNRILVYHATLIANFVLRETTPTKRSIAQFAVLGMRCDSDDVCPDPINAIAYDPQRCSPIFNTVIRCDIEDLLAPEMITTGKVKGTGRAIGPCIHASFGFEGFAEPTVLGSAFAQCSRINTVNGPSVTLRQLQSMIDQINKAVGLPAQNLTQLNLRSMYTSCDWRS